MESLGTTSIAVGDTELTVAVAGTGSERRTGLRGVERLPEGIDGMLFDLGSTRSAVFTMEGVPLTLDIWWFDAEGVLLGSAGMEPCPESECVSYRSPGPIRWALETPRGRVSLEPGAVLSGVDER